MNPFRYAWVFALIALIGGAVGGLLLAWGPLASAPGTSSPADLRRAEKERYIQLVASAYAEERDLRQARERLERLQAGNAPLWVAELAKQEATRGEEESAARLARLAMALAVTEPQIVRLAATPTSLSAGSTVSAESYQTWRVVEQGPLTCAEYARGTQPALVIVARSAEGFVVEGLTLRLKQGEQAPISARTGADGQALLPLRGDWILEVPGGDPLSVSDQGLVASCGNGSPARRHAFRVVLEGSR